MIKCCVNALTFIVSTAKIVLLIIFVTVMSTTLLFADDTTLNTIDEASKSKEQPKLSLMTLQPDITPVSDYRGNIWTT